MSSRDGEVVKQPDIWDLDPGFPGQAAVPVETHDRNVVGRLAARFVAERDELARLGVDLRMRREREAPELAVERVVIVERLERFGVDDHRRAVLFQHQQLPMMENDARIRRAAAQARDACVVRVWIAVGTEQRLARRRLRLVALRADIAAAVVYVPVREAEDAEMPFAVERDVRQARRILEVRTDAVEAAAQVRRDPALDLAIAQVDFHPKRRVEPLQRRLPAWLRTCRESRHLRRPSRLKSASCVRGPPPGRIRRDHARTRRPREGPARRASSRWSTSASSRPGTRNRSAERPPSGRSRIRSS